MGVRIVCLKCKMKQHEGSQGGTCYFCGSKSLRPDEDNCPDTDRPACGKTENEDDYGYGYVDGDGD